MSASNKRTLSLAPVLRLAFALAALCLFAAPAQAREAINSFVSNITLLKDGTVDVTEILKIYSDNNQIRRGITRDIPTTLTNPDGSLLRSDFRVISVQRDNAVENYEVENLDNHYKRIRIGNADVMLDRGPHVYVIHYTMSRMGRTFPDHDELYWNATGNYWDFPIDQAVANITLPIGAVISNLAVFTGPVGSSNKDADITRTSDNTAKFITRDILVPGDGLTVVAAFQKGVLAEPSAFTSAMNYLSDHRSTFLPAIAAIIVLLYNFLAWNKVGRDPAKGVIIPLFHAPENFSPALVHYIHFMGWKQGGWTAFTASIFNLGVKGLVTVNSVASALTIKITGKEPRDPLPLGEKGLFTYFRNSQSITIGTSTGVELNTKRGEFIQAIESESRLAYFRNNAGYSVFGFLIGFALLFALAIFDAIDPVWLVISIVAGVVVGIFSQVFAKLWSGSGFSKFFVIFWVAIAGFNLIGGVGDWATDWHIDSAAIAAMSIVAVNIVFAIIMRAPTMQGRKVMDQIDGFLMYLNTAEKQRLNMTGEPPMTTVRFETILPYAIALGVEKPWTKYFESELARHAVSDAQGSVYTPLWYHGTTSSFANFSDGIASIPSAMSQAMVSAQPVSSSSSGFSSSGGGGGGSSGGGGGGGGGGGW